MLDQRKRYVFLLTVDACLLVMAITLAYLLRFDFRIDLKPFAVLPYVIVMHLLIVLPALHIGNLYKRVWQYASVGELVTIVKVITVSEFVFVFIHMLLQIPFPDLLVPRSLYISAWVLIILSIGGSRFAWRMFRDNYFKMKPAHDRALIVGAGSAGAMIARDLKHSPATAIYPVAFVDDNPAKQSLELLGLPIVGTTQDIPDVVRKYQISKIIIAMPSAPRKKIAAIIDRSKKTKANIKILPGMSDIIKGKITLNTIRDVDVEDLLGREPVKIDMKSVASYVTGEVVLVTGAGGSIGSELCRQIAPFSPKKLLMLGHGENSIYEIELELRKKYRSLTIETIIADIQDTQRMDQVFKHYRPGVVFHAAAHKHVPLMERNPAEAVKNNVLGTKNVATRAHEYGTRRFVMISTDKAVNPTSIMGATKRVAEMIVQSLDKMSDTKFAAVRFGNVLGSRGSVIPVFKKQIADGGPVTVTHPEMVRYFMTIPEAVQLVIQTGAFASGGEIFILDMGEPVRIADLAKDLISLSGLEPEKDIEIVYTGIRPGEKLYEELLTAEEGTTATKHDRIFVGQPLDFELDKLYAAVEQLERIVAADITKDQNAALRQALASIVPTYDWRRDQMKAGEHVHMQREPEKERTVAVREKVEWAAHN